MRGIVRIAKNRDENHVILLNENKSFVEQNYHGFHELTHILTVDEPGTTLNCFGNTRPNQNSYDDVIFEPLAEHFAKNGLFDELRFLCERGIRFSVEDMLSTIKSEKDEHETLDIETIRDIDVANYVTSPNYSGLGEIAKYRKRALDQIIRYMGYLEQVHAPVEYLEQVKDLQKSVADLTTKAKDLKPFRFRL